MPNNKTIREEKEQECCEECKGMEQVNNSYGIKLYCKDKSCLCHKKGIDGREIVEDEKGSGGLWDKAGEVALNYEIRRAQRDTEKDESPLYTDEELQEMIYNALTNTAHTTLLTQLQEIEDMVEGKEMKEPATDTIHEQGYKKGYNDALTDLLSALKEKKDIISKDK